MPKPRSPELNRSSKVIKEPKESNRASKQLRSPNKKKPPRESKKSEQPKVSEYSDEQDTSNYNISEAAQMSTQEQSTNVGAIVDHDRSVQYNNGESIVHKQRYPEAISNLIEICLSEAYKVREAFKGRNRQNYIRIFQAYKDKLNERDYSIIRGATGYLYDYSRINSIDENTALWMLGIHEIPASQIVSYTSKAILEKIAKNHGLLYSGKKAETLIQNIRSVLDYSK